MKRSVPVAPDTLGHGSQRSLGDGVPQSQVPRPSLGVQEESMEESWRALLWKKDRSPKFSDCSCRGRKLFFRLSLIYLHVLICLTAMTYLSSLWRSIFPNTSYAHNSWPASLLTQLVFRRYQPWSLKKPEWHTFRLELASGVWLAGINSALLPNIKAEEVNVPRRRN